MNFESQFLRQHDFVGWRSQGRIARKFGRVSTSRNKAHKMKPGKISDRLKDTSLESSWWTSSSHMCSERRIILNPTTVSLTLPGQVTQIWMWCKKNVSSNNWNVDVDRTQSDSWKGFTKFTSSKEKPLPGQMTSGERLTKIQAITKPWFSVASDLDWQVESSPKRKKKKEKLEWAMETQKFDTARRHLPHRSGRRREWKDH